MKQQAARASTGGLPVCTALKCFACQYRVLGVAVGAESLLELIAAVQGLEVGEEAEGDGGVLTSEGGAAEGVEVHLAQMLSHRWTTQQLTVFISAVQHISLLQMLCYLCTSPCKLDVAWALNPLTSCHEPRRARLRAGLAATPLSRNRHPSWDFPWA